MYLVQAHYITCSVTTVTQNFIEQQNNLTNKVNIMCVQTVIKNVLRKSKAVCGNVLVSLMPAVALDCNQNNILYASSTISSLTKYAYTNTNFAPVCLMYIPIVNAIAKTITDIKILDSVYPI